MRLRGELHLVLGPVQARRARARAGRRGAAVTRALLVAIAALLVALVPACGRYGWMPAHEQEPFRRCVCSHPGCSSAQTAQAERYASLPESRRYEYLESIAPGCYDNPRNAGSSGYGYSAPTSGGAVHVRGYYRRDGTYVRPHTRSRPR